MALRSRGTAPELGLPAPKSSSNTVEGFNAAADQTIYVVEGLRPPAPKQGWACPGQTAAFECALNAVAIPGNEMIGRKIKRLCYAMLGGRVGRSALFPLPTLFSFILAKCFRYDLASCSVPKMLELKALEPMCSNPGPHAVRVTVLLVGNNAACFFFDVFFRLRFFPPCVLASASFMWYSHPPLPPPSGAILEGGGGGGVFFLRRGSRS